MADYQLTQTGAEVQDLLDVIGTDTLVTTAQTLTGAVNELDEVSRTLGMYIEALQTTVAEKANVAISTTVTLASASWTSGTLYTQAVTVSGLLATDVPFCQAVCDDETDAEAWGAIIKATPTADTLTFTATEAPSVDLDIQVVVIR